MRTFSAGAQAAMDSGQIQPYIKLGVVDTDPYNFQAWETVVYYKLTDTELEAKIPLAGASVYASDSPYIAIRRGVVVNGAPEYTTSTSFTVRQISRDPKYLYYKAHILPKDYKALPANLTYKQVLEQLYLDELNPTNYILKPTYEFSAHAVWNYQFYPTGRTVVFNSVQSLVQIFKQKFLIFLRHTENTFTDSKIDIYFFQPTETRAIDYTITDLLYKSTGIDIPRQFIWRDDAGSISTYNPSAGSGLKPPVHNLGYIPAAGTRPTYKISPDHGSSSSKLAPNLKYESGDYVTITTYSGDITHRIKVTEIFDIESTPSWYVIIEPLVWFDNTEGGALPSTIEAAAPYTPLNTTNFNHNLDSTVNNLQSLAEAVDELPLGGSLPDPTATNDFLLGAQVTGVWQWVKKTFAETVTVLRTSLDSIYAPIAKGVTNGDTHDHNGGDGAQIDHSGLANIGTNTHAQIDSALANGILYRDVQVLSSDGVFDFTNIPNTGKKIVLEIYARSNVSAQSDGIKIKFNNDTGNNYIGAVQWVDGSPGSTQQKTAGAPPEVTYITGNTGDANWFSHCTITIMAYANTVGYKNFQVRGMQVTASGNTVWIYDGGSLWLSTNAINQVTPFLTTGTQFKTGSIAELTVYA